MWSRWLVTLSIFMCDRISIGQSGSNQNYKISPNPCSVNGLEGTCMFVWECIKSEGQHVGMCVDSFMFGSCCAHNLTENIVLPQTQSFHRPQKPNGGIGIGIGGGGLSVGTGISGAGGNNKYRPPTASVSSSSLLSTNRPNVNGNGLVKRPAVTPKPLPIYLHQPTSGGAVSTKYPSSTPYSTVLDLTVAESISTGSWSTQAHTTQWQVTTQPNFITKPHPSPWDKVTSSRPKPKPSKKPILVDRPIISQQSTVYHTLKPATVKPKPQLFQPKPTKYQSSSSARPTSTATKSTTIASTKITTTTTTTITTVPTTITTTTSATTTTTRPITTSTSTSISSTTRRTSPSASTTVSSPASATNAGVVQSTESRWTVSAARDVECGIPTMNARPETRIVGGKNAPFGRWPWQVSVRRTSFFGFSSTHRCGGAVLNANWIATAGHCVDDLLTSQIRIRVGEYDFSHVQEQLPYTERAVAKKVVHPKYNFFTYEYDLALVKLEQPLEFAPHIGPICLPGTDDLLIGENATVTGWGRLSEGGTLPSVLQEVSVPIVSNDRCKTMFLRAGRHEFIPEIFLCAGHETGGQDSCQGDSGGPLQVKGKDGRFFLAGIISWGIGCAEANLPGVCTRISKFVPWIMETVT